MNSNCSTERMQSNKRPNVTWVWRYKFVFCGFFKCHTSKFPIGLLGDKHQRKAERLVFLRILDIASQQQYLPTYFIIFLIFKLFFKTIIIKKQMPHRLDTYLCRMLKKAATSGRYEKRSRGTGEKCRVCGKSIFLIIPFVIINGGKWCEAVR